MKPGIILCACLLVLAGMPGLHAADVKPPKPPKSAKLAPNERRLAELVDIYSLSGEQRQQLQLLFEQRFAALEALKANKALDEKARAKQSRAIFNRTDQEFTATLTPEQQRLKKRLAEERAEKKAAK